jgi:hypothetical protein
MPQVEGLGDKGEVIRRDKEVQRQLRRDRQGDKVRRVTEDGEIRALLSDRRMGCRPGAATASALLLAQRLVIQGLKQCRKLA